MRNNSLLCVGLDPDIPAYPWHLCLAKSMLNGIKGYCLHIIEQTAGYVCVLQA